MGAVVFVDVLGCELGDLGSLGGLDPWVGPLTSRLGRGGANLFDHEGREAERRADRADAICRGEIVGEAEEEVLIQREVAHQLGALLDVDDL